MKRQKLYFLAFVGTILVFSSCKKDSTSTGGSLYVPEASDVTATASLVDLQKGHDLYVANCGACHSLYSPDDYSASSWKSVLSNMVPKTRLTQSDAVFVDKYVSRGK